MTDSKTSAVYPALRRIISGSAIVAGFGVLASGLGLAKDLIVAFNFGVSASVDAYLVALVIPSFVISVVAGSFPAALMPALTRTHHPEEANQLVRTFTGYALVATLLISVALLPAVYWLLNWVARGFSAATTAQAMRLFWIMLPCIVIFSLNVLWTTALNAERKFAVAAASRSVVPISIAIIVILLASDLGAVSLAIGTLVGFLLQTVIVGLYLRSEGQPLAPMLPRIGSHEKSVIEQYLPVIVSAVLLGSTTLVDQSMAAMLPEGSVSTLSYGTKVVGASLSLGTVAVGTVLIPELARYAAARQFDEFARILKVTCLGVLAISVVMAAAFIGYADGIIALLFQRGAFSADDTLAVSAVQVMSALQIPFFAVGMMFVRALSALLRNALLMWGALISLPLNIILNLVLMEIFGVAGIALSTSCVYAVSSVFLGFWVWRTLRIERMR